MIIQIASGRKFSSKTLHSLTEDMILALNQPIGPHHINWGFRRPAIHTKFASTVLTFSNCNQPNRGHGMKSIGPHHMNDGLGDQLSIQSLDNQYLYLTPVTYSFVKLGLMLDHPGVVSWGGNTDHGWSCTHFQVKSSHAKYAVIWYALSSWGKSMVFEMKRMSSTIFHNIKVMGLEWNLLIANHKMPKYWKYCTDNALWLKGPY